MEQSIPQSQPKTEAEYIAAIEEMERRIASSFARMDTLDEQTQLSMKRTQTLLTRVEEIQAARHR